MIAAPSSQNPVYPCETGSPLSLKCPSSWSPSSSVLQTKWLLTFTLHSSPRVFFLALFHTVIIRRSQKSMSAEELWALHIFQSLKLFRQWQDREKFLFLSTRPWLQLLVCSYNHWPFKIPPATPGQLVARKKSYREEPNFRSTKECR